MRIILLTHSREVSKKTNTGQLVQQQIPNTQTIIWQRTEPDEILLNLISTERLALVYPATEKSSTNNICDFDNFLLIDGTWQEARKIYNRSAYLHNLPHVQLTPKKNSNYNLRRNQIADGLCTVECVIELLNVKSNFELASELQNTFSEFNKA